MKIEKNSKLLQNVVNGLIKKCNNKNEINNGNTVQTELIGICNAFNDHFAMAGKRVTKSIKPSKQTSDVCGRIKKVPVKLKFRHVTEAEICWIVNELKPKTSSGIDGVSNLLLKQIVSVIKGPLCLIFNKSLWSGVFPDLMKCAKEVPLLKHGDIELPDNYRPISLLPVISKVLERVVYNMMVAHLTVNEVLYQR